MCDRTVRRAYSFHELSEEAFNLTLQLVSGKYPSRAFKDLRPRVSLDRVTGRISPLPGFQRLVISNGGAIPDTGQYGIYLADTNLKIGELDEEFVYESREGDTFSLGTNNWKILKIEVRIREFGDVKELLEVFLRDDETREMLAESYVRRPA